MKQLESKQSSEKVIVMMRGIFECQSSCDFEKGFIVWEEKKKGFTTVMNALTFVMPRISIIDTNEIIGCLDTLETNFADLQTRQLLYFKLKSRLADARDNSDVRNESILLLLNMLLDALANMKSENLTIENVQTIRSVIKEIDESLTKSRVFVLQKKLFEAGFKPVPKLEGISGLYEL